MFCKNCGKDIKDSKFCPNCGAKASDLEEDVIVATAVEDEEPKEPYYGEYGELVMPDGKRIFDSADAAIQASAEAVKTKVTNLVSKPLVTLLTLTMIAPLLTLLKAEDGWWWVSILILIPPILILSVMFIVVSINGSINAVKIGKWLKVKKVDIKETIENDCSNNKNSKNHLMWLNLLGDAPGWAILGSLNILASGNLFISVYLFIGAIVELGHLTFSGFLSEEKIIFCIFIAIIVVYAVYFAACILFTAIIRAIQNAVAKSHLENENQEEENA